MLQFAMTWCYQFDVINVGVIVKGWTAYTVCWNLYAYQIVKQNKILWLLNDIYVLNEMRSTDTQGMEVSMIINYL